MRPLFLRIVLTIDDVESDWLLDVDLERINNIEGLQMWTRSFLIRSQPKILKEIKDRLENEQKNKV